MVKLLKLPYVYELDFSKFFDNVELSAIDSELEEMGIPESIIYMLHEINRSPVTLPKNLKLDETLTLLKQRDLPKHQSYAYPSGLLSQEKDYSTVGVPQGAPTSPSLATLALREVERRAEKEKVQIILYADDVILASSEDFNPNKIANIPEIGVRINYSKSK